MGLETASLTQIKKNMEFILVIEGFGSMGEGVGRINGLAVFVSGALPQETVKIKIVKVKKNYAYGKLLEILEPSKDRRVPPCPYFPRCGGCQLQHMSYEAQLLFKENKVRDALERIGGLSDVTVAPTVGMAYPFHYRTKAQIPVGTAEGGPKIGFYAARSHDIVPIDHCVIQSELMDEIISCVKKFMQTYHVSAYDEINHRGIIRHIMIREGRFSGEIMVCIVINAKSLPHQNALAEDLAKIDRMASIVININQERTNVVLGQQCKVIWGKPDIIEKINGIAYHISALSFFQVNPAQTCKLYDKALELANLDQEKTVLDLYCGLGSISLLAAQKAKSVLGIEIVPQAVADAKRNAQYNHVNNARFLAGQAEKILPKLVEEEDYRADVAILDPPRKGCDKAVIQALTKIRPQRIVYISCDPATLARDIKEFTQEGYLLSFAQPFDMFGFNFHCEVCCLLIDNQREKTQEQ